ncbi:MAG: glycosyltransferase [Chloroflexota bacterium]
MMNKQIIQQYFNSMAPQRPHWYAQNHLYHDQIVGVCKPFLNADSRVLELGCSTGQLLAALNPAYGLGIDLSPDSIREATRRYPDLDWLCADVEHLPADERLNQPFDLIIIEDLLGYLEDIQTFLETIKGLSHSRTRIIVSTWNWLWEPILRLGERLHLKASDLEVRQNWISATALINFLEIAGYDTVYTQPGLLLPYAVPVIAAVINSLSYAPIVRRFTLLSVLVARPLEDQATHDYSVSVVIPTRNEAGNIQALIDRMPRMGTHTELVFVDGNSTDGTVEEIQRVIRSTPQWDIKFIPQVPPVTQDAAPTLMLKLGKGDAVRKGFQAASGDILMILDSDISVAPEALPRFYNALAAGKGQFANGTRFVYSQQMGAMRPLNRLGNVFFSLSFSWLLGQEITDTLCGTKVLFKRDYERIAANRDQFGDFDPFGDFDLLFGAAWIGLRLLDVPVHYAARTYGHSKVRVSSHGPLLGRMGLIALWHFKIKPLFTGKKPMSTEQSIDHIHQIDQPTQMPTAVPAGLVVLVLGLLFWLWRGQIKR